MTEYYLDAYEEKLKSGVITKTQAIEDLEHSIINEEDDYMETIWRVYPDLKTNHFFIKHKLYDEWSAALAYSIAIDEEDYEKLAFIKENYPNLTPEIVEKEINDMVNELKFMIIERNAEKILNKD